jgi:tetratricopeptide (TPR) repeat protein
MALESLGRPEAGAATQDLVQRLFAAGRQLTNGGAPGQAVAPHRRAVALNPQAFYLYHHLAEAELFSNDINTAAASYRRALHIDPCDSPSLSRLTDVNALLNLWPAAARVARRGLEVQPGSGMLHYVSSLGHFHLRRLDVALRAIRRAIRLDGERAAFLFHLGQVLRELGALEPALEAFRAAGQADKERPDTHFNAALCAVLLGRPVTSLPENTAQSQRWLALARQRAREGNWRAATELYNHAIAARPDDPALADELERALAAWKERIADESRPIEERNPEWVAFHSRQGEARFRRLLIDTPGGAGLPGTIPARPAGHRPRVWDSCMFFNELDLLEVRLNELSEVVDRFVIAESPWTHQGRPKELLFWNNRERFAAFADRIVHVVAQERQGGIPWIQETYQRRCLEQGCAQAADDDLLIVADLDEIPRRDVIARIRDDHHLSARLNGLSTVNYNYFINFASHQPFIRPLVMPCWMMRRLGVNLARHLLVRSGPHMVTVHCEAGWHFSWFGGVDAVMRKFENFCHLELLPVMPTREAVMEQLDSGTLQIFGGRLEGRFVPIDASFPAWVRDNLDHVQRLGWVWQRREGTGGPPAAE